VSGHRETADYSHVIHIFIISLCVSGILNLKHDSKLREAASSVNNKVIEKFMVSKKRKCFQASNWGSIQTGDIFKVKSNIEIPCDALILNIVGSKGEFQTCYQKGSLWDDTKIPTLKRSYQGTMNKTSS
jgi:magnesium-transporting ATPase (P-type)